MSMHPILFQIIVMVAWNVTLSQMILVHTIHVSDSTALGIVSQHWPSPLHWELYLIMAQPFKRELQLQL